MRWRGGLGQRGSTGRDWFICWEKYADVMCGMLRYSPAWKPKWVPHWMKAGRFWRSVVTLALCLGVLFAVPEAVVLAHPIKKWILWDYLTIWSWQAFFSLACLCTGSFIVTKGLKLDFSSSERTSLESCSLEHCVVSMATGVLFFVFAMYVGGALRWFGPAFAVMLPLCMLAPALWQPRRLFRGAKLVLARPLATTLMSRVAWVFGLLGVILLYLQTATPEAITYDAGWSHLTVAEDYAREGRIVPFDTNTPKNLPHLSSILYTWSFLLPGLHHPVLHWMSAQHTEVLLFGWTLVGVAAAVRFVLPGSRVSGAWAAVFLFPGLYVYDSNLGAAADHVAAFFAIPFLLVSLRASESFRPSLVILSGLLAGALLHTKFQASYLIAPVAAWFVLRWFWLFVRLLFFKGKARTTAKMKDLLLAPALHVGMTLLAFGPHLLKNWLFYRNPFYPLMLDVFASRPYLPGFPLDPMKEATASVGIAERLESAARVMFSFSFEPKFTFIGNVPAFGSLFTLLSPLGLLCFRRWRVLGILLLGQAALFVWAFVYPVDRNLQLLLPWLAAYVGAVLVLAWQWGLFARLGVGVLVILQVSWGAKFMLGGGEPRVAALMSMWKSDISSDPAVSPYDRFRSNYQKLSKLLPSDAVVLLHSHHVHLGIHRRTVADWTGWQYLIDYRPMKTPRDLYLRYRELGITHMIWNNYDFPGMKQEDVLFFVFTRKYAKRTSSPGFSIWEMPTEAPPAGPPLQVLSLGLHGYSDGLYFIDDLGVVEEGGAWRTATFPPPRVPLDETRFSQLLDSSDAVLSSPLYKMTPQQKNVLRRCFRNEHTYWAGYRVPNYSVYLRRDSCAQVNALPRTN